MKNRGKKLDKSLNKKPPNSDETLRSKTKNCWYIRPSSFGGYAKNKLETECVDRKPTLFELNNLSIDPYKRQVSKMMNLPKLTILAENVENHDKNKAQVFLTCLLDLFLADRLLFWLIT